MLAVPIGLGTPAAATPAWNPPSADRAPGIPVAPIVSTPRPTWTATGHEVRGLRSVSWPRAATARISLDATHTVPAAAATAPAAVSAAARLVGLPVSVAAVVPDDIDARTLVAPTALRSVGVRVHDRGTAERAGVTGVLVEINRTDGVRAAARGSVTVDYRTFADAYGGDWATRLRLVTLPACALTTPEVAGCTTATPLPSRNDPRGRSVTAVAPLSASGASTLLALSSGSSGDNGDYAATTLSPASTWKVSPQTGTFSWSYPLRMVPGVGGPTPSLALSYSSQAVDGRTGGTNTQGSWIGDGWDMWPGYIEREYRQCGEDTDAVDGKDPNNKTKKTGDQCWWKNNATISSNVTSGELVFAGGTLWKGVNDDGTKVELLPNNPYGNGDNDGEYWRVTSVDGTQYYFGRNRGEGGTSGSTNTNSVWTSPVYGNHPGEPGYTAGDFSASRVTQAWRWNLDYVVDPHGNTMTFFYSKETGAYGRENDSAKRTTYDRGGWLTRIEYGNRRDASSSTYAAARVEFDVVDRCTATTCFDSGGKAVQSAWPDTPWDQYCAATPCTDKYTPTFWTQKQLTKIRTQIHTGSGSYSDVESWALRQEFLNAGSTVGEGIPLYLRGITRTGHVTSAGGTAVSDPEVVFDPGADPFANRVDGPEDDRTALKRWRVRTITTESGQQIVVTFKPVDCVRSALPKPESNTQRCFPQYYAPEGAVPTLDWFHKYVVDYVDTNDNTGASTQQKMYYDYLDSPAWHYDDSELIKEKKRTWSQFRGYGQVKVRSGFDTGVQLATVYRYFRGMDGDRISDTQKRSVSVTDSFGGSVVDHDAYSGMTLEETTLDGANGAWVSGNINIPSTPVQTAAANSLKAWMTSTEKEREYSRTTVEADGIRWTETQTKYNSDNLPYEVNDLGDVTTTDDDTCERTWYARNSTNWMLDRVKRSQTVGVACTATSTFPADLISESRVTYDNVNNNWDTYLPTRGLPVKTEVVASWNGTTPVWETASSATYDANGRATSTTDALGRTGTTTYTPALTGPLTSTREVNPKGHDMTTTLAPAWGMPVTTVDANGARTDMTYDGLGRLRQVWLPGRDKATQSSNTEFQYLMRNTKPTAVTSKTLLPSGNAYRTTVRLYDGWLRERQVQTQAPGGGRTLADIFYDSRGLTWYKTNPFEDTTGAPVDTELVGPAGQTAPPAVTEFLYDGAGRTTTEILRTQGISGPEKWRTTTTYNGDLTTITPPLGGTKTATLVDGLGRMVERRQFRDATSYDTTRYTYYDTGELATATDPAGNVWRSFYDQRGRKIRDEDPDKGVTTFTYDAAGQTTTVTDARQKTVAMTYDELGRPTSRRADSVTGPLLADWTYDTYPNGTAFPNGIGRLTQSTRYDQGRQYVTATNGYDVSGRATGTTVTIPTTEGALCASTAANPCSYSFTTRYNADGQPSASILPAVSGDLAAEQLLFGYNDVGAATTITSGLGIYVYSARYDKLGNLVERINGAVGKRVQTNYTFDDTTGRLVGMKVSPENAPVPADRTYDYDPMGNLVRVNDTPYGQPADTQCYRYDYLRRLTEAWTPGGGNCATDPTVAGLGGPAPFWKSYEYTGTVGLTGNRTREVTHAAVGDTKRVYTYPPQGGAVGSDPHALSRVDNDFPDKADTTDTYGYDELGNLTSRTVNGRSQTLTWDLESHLATVVENGNTVSYLYDADGNRLIRRDPQGSGTTLYLPTGMEVTVAPGATNATCTRYYGQGGQQIGVRTKSKMTWIIGDHHGTGDLQISSTDLSVQYRRTLPFGEERQATPTGWAGDKGFLGGTKDNSGLTHLGAREYEPTTGRFVSVDPVMDASDPQQWNAYVYSNNNPSTYSDPSGEKFEEEDWGEYSRRLAKHRASQKKKKSSGGGGGGHRNPARAAFFGPVSGGTVRIIITGGPKAPGNGIIVATFFIQDDTAAFVLSGDSRGFSTNVNAPYRIAMAWDTDTGEISYTVTASCSKSGSCAPQPAIRNGGSNSATITAQKNGTSDGSLTVKYAGLNSKTGVKVGLHIPGFPFKTGKFWGCCSVDGELSIGFETGSWEGPDWSGAHTPTAGDFKGSNAFAPTAPLPSRPYYYRQAVVHLKGDDYPSFQVVQYEGNGNARYLAQDRTNVGGVYVSKALPPAANRDMTWRTDLPGAGVFK